MTNRCHPGVLAYITRGPNVDAIVTVVEFDAEWSAIEKRTFWIVEARSALKAFVGDLECRSVSGSIADANLRPISGVPVNDEVTDDLEITA